MKRTMIIETLSLNDLEKKGYKQRQDGSGWYLGNSKWPTHKISPNQEALLDRSFEISDIKGEKVMVVGHDGDEYFIPMHLIISKIS
jgi:hypothetical protein